MDSNHSEIRFLSHWGLGLHRCGSVAYAVQPVERERRAIGNCAELTILLMQYNGLIGHISGHC